MKKRTLIASFCFSVFIVISFLEGIISTFIPQEVVSKSIIFRMYMVEYSVRLFGIDHMIIALLLGSILWYSLIKERKDHARYILTFVPIIIMIGKYLSMLYDDLNVGLMLPIVIFIIFLHLFGFFLSKEHIKQSRDDI